MSEWKMVGKPALIFIHMQHAITHPEGKLAVFGHAKATRESGIISRQQALLRAFREKKLPVVFVNAVTPETKWPAYGRFWESVRSIGANLQGRKMWRSFRSSPRRRASRSSSTGPSASSV